MGYSVLLGEIGKDIGVFFFFERYSFLGGVFIILSGGCYLR